MQRGGDSNASKAGQTGEATAGRAEGVSQSGARGDPNERRTGEESGERGERLPFQAARRARASGGVAEGGGGGKSEGISESCKESCKER